MQAARRSFLVLILLPLLLGACTQLGPRAVVAGHGAYNTALHDTADAQLLLNLVRLRYLERPYFLEVASVTSQFTFTSRAAPSLTLDGASIDDVVPIDVEAIYEETPTVSYQPLQGEAFVRRLLAPLPVEALILLSRSGWSIERLMRVCVQRANGVDNAVTASGPTPITAPRYAQFLELARLARALQSADQVAIRAVMEADGSRALALALTHDGVPTPESERLAELLDLEPGRTSYPLAAGPWSGDRSIVDLEMRSLNGILYYLSHGVDVPSVHAERGYVRQTLGADGAPFDWSAIMDGLMRVRSGTDRPSAVDVAIRYRDHWYWIAADDLESKTTFSLLTQLFALQAGTSTSEGPVLTLPVGG